MMGESVHAVRLAAGAPTEGGARAAELPRLTPDGDDKTTGSAPRSTGVLPHHQILQMIEAGEIAAADEIEPGQVQPASLDLRLGRTAYRVSSSFLPGKSLKVIERVSQLEGYAIDLTNGFVLEKGCVYVIELQETLNLPSQVFGFANPKSSTGRLDVLTRLITDHGTAFDEVERGYDGPLYVEVAPRSFSVIVRPGTRLNQIRFHRGDATIAKGELDRRFKSGELIRASGDPNPPQNGLVPVTIDLKGDGPGSIIGYRAKKHTNHIDLGRIGYYDPGEYWEEIRCMRDSTSLVLDPDEFYILVTREEVRIPPDLAAEMVAYHTRSGEYRVHYAGFFDPGFGWDISTGGSRAVLEVRSHEVPFMLEHGQPVGWLRYEWVAGGKLQKLYGSEIGSNYQGQRLALAKQFRRSA